MKVRLSIRFYRFIANFMICENREIYNKFFRREI